jgi:hypothetical protein
MGWEQRGGRSYYYRSRRVGGRVVKDYVGTGLAAEQAAFGDADRRRERAEARAAEQRRLGAEQARSAPAEALLAELDAALDAATAAAFYAAGYRRHDRGAWRKRRHGREEG